MDLQPTQLIQKGIFSFIDLEFGRFLARISGIFQEEVFLAGALVSKAVREGDVCLDLREISGKAIKESEASSPLFKLPEFEQWKRALVQSPVVGNPGEFTPLVIDSKERLYLYRYWQYEQDLAKALLALANRSIHAIEPNALSRGLERLFGPQRNPGVNWQKLAAFVAATRPLAIISGGPGTGKTTTVSRILALISYLQGEGKPRIALTAPTGKAASRLQEAVEQSKSKIDLPPEILETIPSEAMTIHRLLGVMRGEVKFRYNRENPLPYDLVVVDEGSMVDLYLMTALLSALPKKGRLILLGDRDQLASVEAGAVLGDICKRGPSDLFSNSLGDTYYKTTGEKIPSDLITHGANPLADCVVQLREHFRFGPSTAIGRVATLINHGRGEEALEALLQAGQVQWHPLPGTENLRAKLKEVVLETYGSYLRDTEPEQLLSSFERFRILSALRRGPYGALGLNEVVETILEKQGLVTRSARHYHGRAVLITRNDYHLSLYNGDVGMVAQTEAGLRAFFPSDRGGLREISPTRLPEHETAYAMTVHKAQGSEFDRVLLILPNKLSPVVTRELIYTAVTRAREGIQIWSPREVFLSGVAQPTRRASGLSDLLYPAR
ncbi:MAG TPA: exodeoxyribonuclease V subunit alpha [Desulfobacterales bacterium]|nr:exodeoxyribonuclease V subunit alpha [Desulfobacterales bacterium]